MSKSFAVAVLLIPLAAAQAGPEADWPTWRYDAARSAASPHRLPAKLHLQWVRRYPQLVAAWKDPINRDRMGYDQAYEPIVAGTTMYLAFNASDKVVALDARTGDEKWRFYADGPVRLPPTVSDGRLYFVSDDGFLYCLDAADGSELWRVRGGPDDRRVLGNQRLISAWPARGGPVVADGAVYFGASIWPFMGTFIHALDARTGKVVWTSDGTGSTFMLQPHRSPAFAGPAPQGTFAVAGDSLLVPNGRSVPAVFDRKTGRMLYYRLADSGKTGGAAVAASGDYFFNTRGIATDMYHLPDGEARIRAVGKIAVLTGKAWYFAGPEQLTEEQVAAGVRPRPRVFALDPRSLRRIDYKKQVWNRKRKKYVMVPAVRYELTESWSCLVDATGALIRAGNRLYAGGKGMVSAVRIPAWGGRGRVDWQAKIAGKVLRLVAARRRLYAVTEDGTICCFGAEAGESEARGTDLRRVVDNPRADEILDRAGIREGYCVVYGGTADLLAGLAARSKLSIVAVVGDRTNVGILRRRLDDAGLYGRRIAVHTGRIGSFNLPPYFASLTVVADGTRPDAAALAKLYRSMRPYGGVCVLPDAPGLAGTVKAARLPGAKLDADGGLTRLVRTGPLPGTDDWTHMYGTAANTVCSRDRLVKAPLGLLWFGGPSHMDVLPRHGHGPPELIVGGRLFIQGIDSVSARDVYTGRVLWKRTLPGLDTFGIYYDRSYNPDPLDLSYNQLHIPGANARGANMAAAPDALYLVLKRSCLKLDPATGRTLAEFALPKDGQAAPLPTWGYVGLYEDLLIAGAEMLPWPTGEKLNPEAKYEKSRRAFIDFSKTSSRRLVAMDRHAGKVRWTFTGRLGLRHNAVAVGGGKVFCVDRLPPMVSQAYARRGEEPPHAARVAALDVRTGRTVWQTAEKVFGTWLAYSAEHDVLLEAGRPSRDMLYDESGSRMLVRRADNGEVVWYRGFRYGGPAIIRGRTVYTDGPAVDLLTGAEKVRRHPLTGEPVPWRYRRAYGCNYAVGSEHMLTFRSAAAGYYNLATDEGTGNIGGFKSGCTSNLIAANGVLNAPDYTRTCTCSYQNQTSLALVHMPDVETWTYSAIPPATQPIRRVGLNLGAPGDRLAGSGTLWLDCPSTGGAGPDVPVKIAPEEPSWFRRHCSAVQAGSHAWVAACGAEGLASIAVDLFPGPPPPAAGPAKPAPKSLAYTVRLYFAEPADVDAGQRVFHVAMQGKRVLKDFDIVQAAGGPRRLIVKEFRGVRVTDELTLSLTPSPEAPASRPVLCGVEIVAEP